VPSPFTLMAALMQGDRNSQLEGSIAGSRGVADRVWRGLGARLIVETMLRLGQLTRIAASACRACAASSLLRCGRRGHDNAGAWVPRSGAVWSASLSSVCSRLVRRHDVSSAAAVCGSLSRTLNRPGFAVRAKIGHSFVF
jgi:hypothetical protein